MTTKIKSDDLYVIDNPVGVQIPRGTTGQRPADARTGTMRFNTSTGELELRKGPSNTWFNLLRTGDSVSVINAGNSVDRPAAGNAGAIWIDLTDTKIYYDNGTEWISVGTGAAQADPVAILQGDLGNLTSGDVIDPFGSRIISDSLDMAADGPLYEVDLGSVA